MSDLYDKDPETGLPVRGRATSWRASEPDYTRMPKGGARSPMLGGLPEPDHEDMACYKGPCICGKVDYGNAKEGSL